MRISFRGYEIPEKIAPKYLTPESRRNTVAVLGSSKATDAIEAYMQACSNVSRALIETNRNIVHGCGTLGIMGAAYDAGRDYSKRDENGKQVQNLAIIQTPLWGDEDLENCIPLTKTHSEAERIEEFAKVADNIVIFPGGPATLQEATTLILKNYYAKPENKKKIVLVGSDYYKGLKDQYDKLHRYGLIKCPPEELFTIADSEEEILGFINKK